MQNISSAQHPLIKHLAKLRQNKDYREEHKQIVIEGRKMVQEVCKQLKAVTVLISQKELLPSDIQAEQIILTTPENIHKITGTNSPEGIIAEVPLPSSSSLQGLGSILALDHVADPGNVGTLIRTALALGWEGVFMIEGGCDPFNPKALRASMGGVFQMPMRIGSWKELRQLAQDNDLKAIAADLHGTPLDLMQKTLRPLLVLGSEAHGLSSQAQSLCEKVVIPMTPHVDSLNVAVAGAILMYRLR